MAAKEQALTVKSLMAIFDVSHVTILNWAQGTPTKKPMPRQASKLKAWAEKHEIKLVKDPIKYASKPGALSTQGPRSIGVAATKIKRNGAGRLSSARAKKAH